MGRPIDWINDKHLIGWKRTERDRTRLIERLLFSPHSLFFLSRCGTGRAGEAAFFLKMDIMNDLEDKYTTVLDDFQHRIENKIRNHKDEKDFPQMPSGLDEQELSDYLFDYQAALDSEGSERSQYTVAGILLCLPILVMSAFPEKSLPFQGVLNVLAAIAIGLVLFGIYKLLMKALVRNRIAQANSNYPDAKEYVEKVLKY